MARWTIYDKNGNVKAITNGITVGSRTMPELEYSGTWMGETFVTISVKSEQPVNWQIGDYLIYRGEKFVLNYDPSVVKKARRNTYGEGFVYDGVKFNSLNVEMSDVQFLDEVLSDNHIHYTSLPAFSFFAATIDDYADRLQANMNRYCLQNNFVLSEWWLILTPSRTRTVARGAGISGLSTRLGAAWDIAYQDEPSTDGEKFNQNVSISKSTVFAGLANIYNLFGLHYVTSGRTLIIGAAGKIASHVFEYGKGNGLYEIERVADSEQQLVTKLYAYGNSTNLPIRYYSNIAKVCVGKVTGIQRTGNTQLSLDTDLPYQDSYFSNRTGDIIPRALVTIRSHVITIGGGVIKRDNNTVMVSIFLKTSPDDPDWYTTDSQGLATLIQQMQVGDELIFVEGADIDKWPAGHFSYGSAIPNNLAINNLMLPGFPTQSLKAWVLANGGTLNQDDTVTWNGHTAFFSTNELAPYILSPNSAALGVREASKTWDGSDDTEDIYPTIENTGDDILVSADIITDNGVFGDGDEVPNFSVVVKGLGADVELDSLISNSGDAAKISMKDGYCGGREFSVVSAEKVSGSTNWKLTLKRDYDEALQLYFPYSNNASIGQTPVANEAYQLRGADIAGYDGDKFVWLGIDMPSEYIEASAEKLLDAALTFLEANDYARYTYSPKVDEIYMAKQHDAAVASQSSPNTFDSLHDTLHEGNLIQFGDEDLQIDGNIFLDKLTIKEYGNGSIPTYDVTLRNHKSVGTYQRLLNTVDSLSGKGGASGIWGNGGVSTSQTKDLIKQEGDKRYIRRDINDETNTDLTANQFIAKEGVKTDVIESRTANAPLTVDDDLVVSGDTQVIGDESVSGNSRLKGNVVFGVDNTPDATHNKVMKSTLYNAGFAGWLIDERGNLEVESLKVRTTLEVEELLINRLQAQEGDTIYTDNDQIIDIEEQTSGGETTYILTFKEKWEGYFTAQRYGNILKGIINTLAANYVSNQQGRGDVIDPESPDWDEQEEDDASYQGSGNKYFTSWMHVVADRNTDQTLGLNQVRVALFPDNEVAQTKNFAPCINMVVGRWGCLNYSEDPAEKASIKRRQSFFYLSSSTGRFMKLNSVSSPILVEGNFGTVLGNIPDFIRQWDSWERLVREHPHLEDRDYLYAQGLIYEDLIKVDITGAPVPVTVFCGDWVNGSQVTPSVGNGIYYNTKWNNTTKQFETHTVRHNNGTWMCLISQPSIDSGIMVYHEPKWNTQYWRLIDGNGNYSIEFESTMGSSFYVGYVGTTITPHLYYGNVDISADIDVQYWSWTRSTESGSTAADTIWNNNHKQMRILTLTDEDMPTGWGRNNKAIFTCTVVVNDGSNQVIIQNQVIA